MDIHKYIILTHKIGAEARKQLFIVQSLCISFFLLYNHKVGCGLIRIFITVKAVINGKQFHYYLLFLCFICSWRTIRSSCDLEN